MASKKAAPAAQPDSTREAPKAATKAEVIRYIVQNPTASDQRVAAEAGSNVDFVQSVRDGMGPRHTWPKPEKED